MATQSPYAKKNLLFAATIAKYLVLTGMDKEKLGIKAHVSTRTVYRRLEAPGDLTLDELRRIITTQGWTQEEILAIL